MLRVTDEHKAKRADALKNMQDIAKEAEKNPDKMMNADQAAKFAAAQADFDARDAEVKRLEAMDAAAQAAGDFAPVGNKPTDESRAGFLNFMRSGDKSGVKFENAMSTGAASAAALVPTTLSDMIIKAMYDAGVMLTLADVITIGAKTDVAVSGTEPTAYWTEENAAVTASDPTLSNITLTPKKLSALVVVSEELVDDSAFDIEAYISERCGIATGREQENCYINSTASGKPTGFMVSASVGATASDTTNHTFSYEDVVSLFTSVKAPYRRKGTFLGSDAALKQTMLLKDGAGQYIFQPSYEAGQPDKLLSKPFVQSEYMAATLAANAKPLAFGDFKAGYKIGIRKALSMQRLVELYAEKGQVGFRFFLRVDGKTGDTNAIKVLKVV